MATEKINLIYIASSAHSGSTLLELLLGAHPYIWTTGEFQMLPWEIKDNRQPCGCGIKPDECVFWRPIIEKTVPISVNGCIHRFRESHGGGKVLRFNELPFIYRKSLNNSNRKSKINKYGKENFELLYEVLQRAKEFKGQQVTWLVDASKDLYCLMWLKQSGYFNIRAIHLLKDPCSFVYSMVKDDRGLISLKNTIRVTRRWVIENYLIDKVCRENFPGEHTLRIRYEDLGRNPQDTMQNIMQWLGLGFSISILTDFRKENHGISGNKMRYQKDGIKLDERWKLNLSEFRKKMIKMLSLIPAKKYGF